MRSVGARCCGERPRSICSWGRDNAGIIGLLSTAAGDLPPPPIHPTHPPTNPPPAFDRLYVSFLSIGGSLGCGTGMPCLLAGRVQLQCSEKRRRHVFSSHHACHKHGQSGGRLSGRRGLRRERRSKHHLPECAEPPEYQLLPYSRLPLVEPEPEDADQWGPTSPTRLISSFPNARNSASFRLMNSAGI